MLANLISSYLLFKGGNMGHRFRNSEKSIWRDRRKVPVMAESEVVVVGGGVAGIAAAVSAAREGVKVLLIENLGILGGTATAGLMNNFGGYLPSLIGGFTKEVIERLGNMKSVFPLFNPVLNGYSMIFDPEVFKYIAMQMLEEEGVKLLLNSMVVDSIVEDKKIKGVFLESKSGSGAVIANVIIDATGDGDVAWKAGVPYQKGREKDGKLQAVTLMFEVGRVNIGKLIKFVNRNKDDFCEICIDTTQDPPQLMVGGFYSLIKKAIKNQDFPLEHELIWVDGSLRNGDTVTINATHIINIDGTSVFDLTRARVEGVKQVMSVMKFLKKYVPGFELSFLRCTASSIGVRETRRIIGEYMLTEEDILSGRSFDDVIARNNAPMDIHSPTDGKQKWVQVKPYDIPYRCLVPQIIDNLLVSGRCISSTHKAFASTRFMPCCMATGQAAGIAAALSVKNKVTPRQLDVIKLQKALRKQGAII